MRDVARFVSSMQFIRMLDVRRVVRNAAERGTIRFDFAHLHYRIRVPFWKVRAVRREIRNSLSIPVTTVCRVGALSMRETFGLRHMEIRL